jgi:hypothetical protein
MQSLLIIMLKSNILILKVILLMLWPTLLMLLTSRVFTAQSFKLLPTFKLVSFTKKKKKLNYFNSFVKFLSLSLHSTYIPFSFNLYIFYFLKLASCLLNSTCYNKITFTSVKFYCISMSKEYNFNFELIFSP